MTSQELKTAKRQLDAAIEIRAQIEDLCASLGARVTEVMRPLVFEGDNLRAAMRSGVYFLHGESGVIYVGQAKTILKRVGQHTDKDFIRVTFVNCAEEDLTKVEEFFIALMQPPLNVRGQPPFPNVRCAIQGFDDLARVLYAK